MTNLHAAIIAASILISAGALFFALRYKIITEFNALHSAAWYVEHSLRAHIGEEVNSILQHVNHVAHNAEADVKQVEENVIGFVKTHADELKQHAADIKNHSLEALDRTISREISSREAVKRT